jgi:hypothetical protein
MGQRASSVDYGEVSDLLQSTLDVLHVLSPEIAASGPHGSTPA